MKGIKTKILEDLNSIVLDTFSCVYFSDSMSVSMVQIPPSRRQIPHTGTVYCKRERFETFVQTAGPGAHGALSKAAWGCVWAAMTQMTQHPAAKKKTPLTHLN